MICVACKENCSACDPYGCQTCSTGYSTLMINNEKVCVEKCPRG